ncbi:MAG TPA: metallophosphoesterase [Polyangium sp.]|nr:metallophosphoesterase [Polyangium sp.]
MSVGRFVVFFLVVSLLLGASSFYVGRRAKQAFGLGRRVEKSVIFVMIAAVGGMIVARVLEIKWLGQTVFTLLLAVLITTGLLLLADLLKLGLHVPLLLWNRRRDAAPAKATEEKLINAEEVLKVSAAAVEKNDLATPMDPPPAAPEAENQSDVANAPPLASTRRVFLGQAVTGSAMLVGSGSSVYGSLFGRHDFILEEVPMRIPGLSKRLDGYTLVQISDIHFGTYIGEREIRIAEELVRQAKPDRLVLTGDLLDSNPKYAEILGRFIRRMTPLARDGVVVIPGNHDWYAGVDIVMDAARSAGARVLRNDGFVVGDEKDGFALLGVEDVWAKRVDPRQFPDLEKAMSAVRADLPRVLLCHNPVFFPEAAGKVALQLSGHTHGGQINIGPIRPGDVVLPYGYVQGRYERDGSQLYVNRGFGTAGPPARVGSPPEVTRVILVAG